jgi:hypothetical protein
VEAGAPEDRAQLWLSVDRPNGKPGFFDNMDDRPVRPPNWTACEIVAEIDRDAQFLDFGVRAIGRGRVWVDDVSFEVVPEEQITAARSAIRRQYPPEALIAGFRFAGPEAVATVRIASLRQGFTYLETFHDTWERTAEGWRRRASALVSGYFEVPDPDPERVREIAADLRQYAIAVNGMGPAVSVNCFAVHRPEMQPGGAEAVLSAAGLRTFFLDLARVPGDSALGRWLAEPQLFNGSPARLAVQCRGILFVEAGNP